MSDGKYSFEDSTDQLSTRDEWYVSSIEPISPDLDLWLEAQGLLRPRYGQRRVVHSGRLVLRVRLGITGLSRTLNRVYDAVKVNTRPRPTHRPNPGRGSWGLPLLGVIGVIALFLMIKRIYRRLSKSVAAS